MRRADGTTPREVLDFWFADALDTPAAAGARVPVWFDVDPDFDAAVRARFADLHAAAAHRSLPAYERSSDGLLALVILLDQLSRNLYRGESRAFATDGLALGLARGAIADGVDRERHPLEQMFLWLPFEHSESLDDQERSVAGVEALAVRVEPEWQPLFASFARYAREHRDLVARFGRFPHRNRVLGRESTPDERAFLAGGGTSFGQ
ncbi:MAG: DUF924 domain-containing protein [Proteobacteria bacterium]|nr:DUF924 domain-containing protein [Pseudomonadota bacterium]